MAKSTLTRNFKLIQAYRQCSKKYQHFEGVDVLLVHPDVFRLRVAEFAEAEGGRSRHDAGGYQVLGPGTETNVGG